MRSLADAAEGRVASSRWSALVLPPRFQDRLQEAVRRRYPRVEPVYEGGARRSRDLPWRPRMVRPGSMIRTAVWFAGAGGASWGLPPHFHVVVAVELEGGVASIHRANMDHPVLQVDVSDERALRAALRPFFLFTSFS